MGGSFSKKKSQANFDPDEKWSNLYREMEKNVMYRWVGIKNGGDLMNIYEREGEDGILRFAEEKITPMLFDDGMNGPHLIKSTDYIKWKKTMNMELGMGEGAANHLDVRYEEHNAMWRLNKRGVKGENVVHLLLNREQEVCHEIARIIIKKWPGLCDDIYLGDEYLGQSAVHLSIVHDDYETLQLLLESGANVNARAIGDFFQPENYTHHKKALDYTGWAYYGEYPLAFAACFGNKDIYDVLIEYGADPNKQDMYGNTILHMCVISNSITMYSYAVRHWQTPADPDVVNQAGYTPLTLATKLGRKEIFDQMLELSKVEFWRFSDMACSAYPLNTLDTIRNDGSTNYDSVLMTVINGTTPDHLDMIGSEVIDRLLEDKWAGFARRKLYVRMFLTGLHLLCMALSAGIRPTELDRLYYDMPTVEEVQQAQMTNKEHPGPRWDDWIRLVNELLTCAFTFWFLYQQVGEVRAQGIQAYLRNMATTPAKIIYLVSNLMIILCIPLRFFRFHEVEEAFLSFAVPGSFMYLLFFARSFKLTGPFVQMIYSMIAGDLFLFGIISSIFIVPSSIVFHFLGADMEAKQVLDPSSKYKCKVTGYSIFTFNTRTETFITLFRASMGGYDYEEFACSNYEIYAKILFVMFMFVMPIMMINILIAMMGNTYTSVIAKAEKAWRRQYAQIIMNLERSIDPTSLAKFMKDYSIKLQDGDEDESEVRGLMVIKKTNKTRTGARQQATFNWRRIGRKVLQTVERLGVEQAQALLHGFEHVEVLDEKRPITKYNRPYTVFQKNAMMPKKEEEPVIGPMHKPETIEINQGFTNFPTASHVFVQMDTSLMPPAPIIRQRGISTLNVETLTSVVPMRPFKRGVSVYPTINLPNLPSSSQPRTKAVTIKKQTSIGSDEEKK